MKVKASILLMLSSILLPLAASRAPLPKPPQAAVGDLSVPALRIPEVPAPKSLALRSPFPAIPDQGPQGEAERLPTLSLLYLGKDRYAVIDGELVREGEGVEAWRVKRIESTGVLLIDEEGEERWVELSPLP